MYDWEMASVAGPAKRGYKDEARTERLVLDLQSKH